jgi:hypothetical protein
MILGLLVSGNHKKSKKLLDLFSMLKANPIIEIKPSKGHDGVFFVNNFENKLTLIERKYVSEKHTKNKKRVFSEEIKNRKPTLLKIQWKDKPVRKSKLSEEES